MKIPDTKVCKICQLETDTIKIAFLECPTTACLWSQVENWTKSKISTSKKFTDADEIFVYQTIKEIVDKIISNTKIVIYNNRKTDKYITLNGKNILI